MTDSESKTNTTPPASLEGTQPTEATSPSAPSTNGRWDSSALSSRWPIEVLSDSPRMERTVKTEHAERYRTELQQTGWIIMTTDNQTNPGYTTFSVLIARSETPNQIDETTTTGAS
ncbi:hypothetical protein I350_00013 [Cryptococcus amylolentus CBS 6273]|uniref:Uncharacterized protein n=1 Tax=Cryptococcus amylolentus CBS 6273 TaxID=1296118 RepID=A0A1E3KDR0_9TREE|nr:hypothetical protein I350_00013 [Cryptococcus amylolentus CBS 6273]